MPQRMSSPKFPPGRRRFPKEPGSVSKPIPPPRGKGGAQAEPPGSQAARAALVLTLFFLIGCAQASAPRLEGPAFLHLEVQARGARLFLPPSHESASFRLSGLGPGGVSAQAESSGGSFSLELLPGAWNLTVEGLSASSEILSRGSLELLLEPGERRSMTLVLLPLEGEGSLALSWTILGDPGPGCLVQGRLYGSEGLEIPLSAEAGLGLISLPSLASGAYTLDIGLFGDGERICGLADSVLILTGLETRAELRFAPPEASLSLLLLQPDFLGPVLEISPLRRRVRAGLEASFRLPAWAGQGSWFLEGERLPASEGCLGISLPEPGRRRIDWVGESPGIAFASGEAELLVGEEASLGPLRWEETLGREDIQASAASRSLDDCRDLAFSPQGGLVATLGREGNSIGLFAYPGAGGLEPIGGLGTSEEPSLGTPSRLRFLPSGDGLILLSEAGASLYRIGLGAGGTEPAIAAEITAGELLGATDLALSPDGLHAYIASPAAEAIFLTAAQGGPSPLLRSAGRGDPGLEALSKPLCLALSADGSLLALGTGGDDAIYIFHRDGASGELSLLERISKEALAALASLSDPVSLAFSPDARSLFALSYYGKALIRLDRDEASGHFLPAAAAKSGTAGVTGFEYPKRLALSPEGDLLVLSATGASDGLAAFAVGGRGQLDYLACLLPDGSDSKLGKPFPLAFSPDGGSLLVASAEEDRLAVYGLGP